MADMSGEEVREALEAIGSQLNQDGDLRRVEGRSRRHRRHRVGAVGSVPIVVLASLSAFILLRSGQPSREGAPRRAVAGAECDIANDGVPTFPQFHEDEIPSGAPGSSIVVTGSGFYVPATQVEVVWNSGALGVDNAPETEEGTTITLASGSLLSGCEFRMKFLVPTVPAGRYPILVRLFDPESEFSVMSEFSFDVTDP
jgi:hypothetical protein